MPGATEAQTQFIAEINRKGRLTRERILSCVPGDRWPATVGW